MEQILEKVHGAGRCCIAIHPSSQYVCIGGWDGFIKQYSYGLNNKSLSISNAMDSPTQYHDDPIHEITFCSSGDYFAICCEDGEVVLFRHPDCSVHSILCKYDCAVSSISFLPSSYSFLLAMASDNGTVKIVNALDYSTNYFEFKCCDDGIRNIKFIPYKPDPFRTSQEKYIAIAQCNGNLSVWKLFKSAIFDENIKEMDQKMVKTQEFTEVFPKIKGGDINQRLDFDFTQNGHLIAIPGSKNIKILDTKRMVFITDHSISHTFASNCCAFNSFLQKEDTKQYILASSDIRGNISIWNIKYDDNIFECNVVDDIRRNIGICNLIWKNEKELLINNMDADVYTYIFEAKPNSDETEKKAEPDSDEDFDIDMDQDNNEPSPTKKVLKRSFQDSDSDADGSLSPSKQNMNDIKSEEITPNEIESKNDILQADLAAAAEMFGDDGDDLMENDTADTNTKQMDIKEFYETEATDLNGDKTEKDVEDIAMEDTAEDLDDFIVEKDETIKDIKEQSMEEDVFEDNREHVVYRESLSHEAFVNGGTVYSDNGQRYLLLNEIGGVIVRKQDVSSNAMEMNIMNSLNNGKYCIEIDFFDKSKYCRAVTFKSDHHFMCCDMNCFGLLLGSDPDDNQQSIVRYKAISRNGEYRSFCSEKDCEWNHILPFGEICVSVGLCHKYALIATNKRFLRILSIGGLQIKHILSLPKNVVNIAGNTNDLRSNIVAITFSDLSLWILDLDHNKKLYDGYCAVTNNASCITRVFMSGNCDNFKLITIDSDNIVRLLSNDMFGCHWIVVLDINFYLNKEYPQSDIATERPKGVWPIYFDYNEQCVMVMELKYLDYPQPSQSNGSCVLTEYKLSVPLLGVGHNEVDPITNEAIMRFTDREEGIMTQSLLHEFTDSNSHKQHKKKLLKEYITLFNHACKGNKPVLAYDIALHFLNSEKALSNAIKVAMHNELPLLAEQLTNLTKERTQKPVVVASSDIVKSNTNNECNNHQSNNNNIKKPTRSLGKLRRPTAKLGGNKKLQSCNDNQSVLNDVTSSMQRTKLTGKKRPNNPCGRNQSVLSQKKPKRNPFSCNDSNNESSNNDRKKTNSIFSCD